MSLRKTNRSGPLAGVTVVEFAGLGPGPFCCMMLADMGARVIRIERTLTPEIGFSLSDPMLRSRESLVLDLKKSEARDIAMKLIGQADVLVEGFRPGVMERLELGPDVCHEVNERLVYGRMSGWGQSGPYAARAGHDINYMAISGALHAIGQKGGRPVPPLNLVGDFGGGAMLLAFGIVSSLYHVKSGGKGQVVDASILDGAAMLMASSIDFKQQGLFDDSQVGGHVFSGESHYYSTYETADGKFVALGCIEPKFYDQTMVLLGLNAAEFDGKGWPVPGDPLLDPSEVKDLRDRVANVIRTKTRAEWCRIFEKADVCFSPVLTLSEAFDDPHNRAHGTYVEVGESLQNAPVPRLSGTPVGTPQKTVYPGHDTKELLMELGFSSEAISSLEDDGVVSQAV